MRRLFLLGLFVFSIAYGGQCQLQLWPQQSLLMQSDKLTPSNYQVLFQTKLRGIIDKPVYTVTHLKSSGVVDKNNPELVNTRRAFIDADETNLLALAYYLNKQDTYLTKAKEHLLTWAISTEPDGNPIDLSRLQSLVWAYDFIKCQLSGAERQLIDNWFTKISQALKNWPYGRMTSINNYTTHALSMRLLISKVIREPALKVTQKEIVQHLQKNINPETGVTIDYKERDALYYQNFDLQPWIEIALQTNCCEEELSKAFNFLARKILSNEVSGEFADSKVKFDQQRATHGFSYTKKGGDFNIRKAAPTAIAFYTFSPQSYNKHLTQLIKPNKYSSWYIFLLMREGLWASILSK